MQGQGQSPKKLERVAHAGLLCIYTLAAVLGLFLHTGQESRPFAHVCGESTPDLDRQDGAPSEHDEARCALCHLHARLGLAMPAAQPALHEPVLAGTPIATPALLDAPAIFVLTPPSRAPPATPGRQVTA